MKKSLFLILGLLLLANLAAAEDTINLEIEKTTINNVIVSELNSPATFKLKIKNNGPSDIFEIYSLVGVDMTPKGTIQINQHQTKEIEVKVYALESLRKNPGFLTFVYKIYGQNTGIQDDRLTINIMNIQDALEAGSYPINPNSTSATIFINNKVNEPFDIKADFSSAFFDTTKEFHIEPLQVKYFNVTLNKEEMKKLIAGQYILTANFIIQGEKHKVTGTMKFTEQEGISTQEEVSGIFFRKRIIEKTNEGNVPIIAKIDVKKNIISRLFTTFNIEPDQVTRRGIFVYYILQQELKPAESLTVKVTTSWLYPIILLLLVLIIAYLSFLYTKTDLILRKRVSFVKTKGGEFALKIYLTAKARRFIEKIEVNDKLPALVKIYEKFPGHPPDKVDHKRHRISWSIEALQPREERVFSYIVYSKVSVVGKFELPPSSAVYEREGVIKETFSNRTFFMNEPLHKGYSEEE